MLSLQVSRRLYCRMAAQRNNWKPVIASPVMKPQFVYRPPISKLRSFSQSSLMVEEAQKATSYSHLKIIGWTVVATIVAIPTLTIAGLYGYYYSLLDEVPITKRKRILWRNAEFEETISWATSYPSTLKRPLVRNDAAEVVLVQKILDRFLGLDLVKGQVIKLFLCDIFEYPNAEAISAVNGGKIFMDNGELLRCQNPDEVACIIAHELAHIISKHSIETNTAHFCARYINLLFGHRAPDGEDLPTKRLQEYEADHIGLLLLAEAGFDPQARIDYLERYLAEESELPDSSKEIPDFLRTHPSTQKRIEKLKTVLPEAVKIYKKQGNNKIILDEWDCVILDLQRRQIEANGSLNYGNMTPEQIVHMLLFAVDRLIGSVEGLRHQIDRPLHTLADQIKALPATELAESDEEAGDDLEDDVRSIKTAARDGSEKSKIVLAAAKHTDNTGPAEDDKRDEVVEGSSKDSPRISERVPDGVLAAMQQPNATSMDDTKKEETVKISPHELSKDQYE